MMMTTWLDLLTEEMEHVGDGSPIEAIAPDSGVLGVEFDSGFGTSEGPPVLVWTRDRVYFPVVYDGAEWLGSAPRHPTAEGQRHLGGQ